MSELVLEQQNITRKKRSAFEKRIHEIDFIRGFLIALVLFDHFMCDIMSYSPGWFEAHNWAFFKVLADVSDFYWYSLARNIVRFFALFGFSFISGISCAFSRNNWVRAGQMLAVYAVIAVGSNVLDASGLFGNVVMRIDFNVIAVLAWSTLFYCFVQNKTWRSILVGVLISFLMFWVVVPYLASIPGMTSSYSDPGYVPSPTDAYAPPLWEPFGQADWLPLFPYMCFFFCGALLSHFVYAKKKESLFIRHNWERPLCFLGRHSLLFYLGHQIVLIPIFMLLNVILG